VDACTLLRAGGLVVTTSSEILVTAAFTSLVVESSMLGPGSVMPPMGGASVCFTKLLQSLNHITQMGRITYFGNQ